jgi:hypothetical protein
VVAKNATEWAKAGKECLADPNKIMELKPMQEVLNISAEHELDDYASAILYHSRKNSLSK